MFQSFLDVLYKLLMIEHYFYFDHIGSNNPFRIASNWEFVDEDGITNVVSGTEYLEKKKDK